MALIIFNYVFLYLPGSYKTWAGLIIFSAFNLVAIWMYCVEIGIKIPKSKKPAWLKGEVASLDKMFEEIYKRISSVQRERAQRANSQCPICHSKKVRKKFRNVKGDIEGDFRLGFGSVSGSIATGEVNFCPDCDHEWGHQSEWATSKKRSSALSEMLSSVYDYFSKSQDNNSDPLKEFKAKSVLTFIRKYDFYDDYKVNDLAKLSVKALKRYGCK